MFSPVWRWSLGLNLKKEGRSYSRFRESETPKNHFSSADFKKRT